MKNKKTQVAITLGIMCFLLAFGIVIQLNTIDSATETVGVARTENDLRDQVLRWKEKYDTTYEELEKSKIELESLRKSAVENDETSLQMEEELKQSNILLGNTEVKGNGVIINLEDGKDLLHDEDLIMIVNELKNAGAEAISINDLRVVNSTYISCDGNVILVDGNKIGTPFTIYAIGNPEMLYGALNRNGGFLEILKGYGIITNLKKANNIRIAKYNGVIATKYLKNV